MALLRDIFSESGWNDTAP